MAPSGGQGPRSPYHSDSDYADYGTNGAGQRFDPRAGYDPRQRGYSGGFYSEDQAHFGPPGTGPLPGDAYYCDDRYYGGPGGGGGAPCPFIHWINGRGAPAIKTLPGNTATQQ